MKLGSSVLPSSETFRTNRAAHLAMLEALAPRDHLRLAYEQALDRSYLWHEFGDLHLLMRGD